MSVTLPTRLPGESAENFVDRLMPVLQNFITSPISQQNLGTVYDATGRPILIPGSGIFAYDQFGNVPVSPDIVQIDTQQIVDAAIETAKLDDNAVTEAKIVNLAVTTAKIHDAAIVTAKIGDLQVTTAKIDLLAVNNAQIANATIGTAKIQNAAITNALIGVAAVGTANIQNAAITNALIDNAAITNAKIGNLEVDSAKIANLTVGTTKITGNAVTNLSFAFDPNSSVATAAAETVIQTTTISSSGAPILVQASGSIENFSTPTIGLFTVALIRFRKNGSNLTAQMPVCVSNQGAYAAGNISLAYVDSPGAGTYTYDITLQNISSFDHGFKSLIFLSALELKK